MRVLSTQEARKSLSRFLAAAIRGTLLGAFAELIVAAPAALAGSIEPYQIVSAEFPDSRFQFVFIEENANLGFYGSDRHFTNGAQASLLSPQLAPGDFANSPMRWLGQNTPLFLRPIHASFFF